MEEGSSVLEPSGPRQPPRGARKPLETPFNIFGYPSESDRRFASSAVSVMQAVQVRTGADSTHYIRNLSTIFEFMPAVSPGVLGPLEFRISRSA